jgi:class 3 adenylate cyclase
LLLNILPGEIADELKKFGKSYARKHDQVSVLFADIKGFTSIAEKLTPVKLVTQLDEVFGAFDNIIAKHGMEKIKTIGDAYMCACGLPLSDNENAIKSVNAALDMQQFIKGFGEANKIQNLPVFEIRIGIHTGPLVAGVVGLKKFAYDIWGDAVNLASQMEQHSETGKVNISGETYSLVKNIFNCTYRGKIEAKSKGEVDMYFVDSVK